MPSNSSLDHGLVAIVLIALSTVVGFFISLETDNLGVLTTWFWVGVGLAGIYLLSTIANSLDQLRTDS